MNCVFRVVESRPKLQLENISLYKASVRWGAVIGYIDPSLNPQQIAAARQQLKQDILSEVNFVEISVRSDGGRGVQVSYYIDGLEFHCGQ